MDDDQLMLKLNSFADLAYKKRVGLDYVEEAPSVGSVNYTPYQIIMAFIVAFVAFWFYILRSEGLDETTLAICVRLCENGANPEAIAKVVLELQRVKREELNSHSRS